MPVVSQSIISPIVPVGASTVAWLLRTPCSSPSRTADVPRLLAGGEQRRPAPAPAVDRVAGVAVHAQHLEHVLLVVGEAGERAHPAGRAGARGVGVPGHQRGDRRGPRPPVGRVVGQAEGHQHARRGWRSRGRAGGTPRLVSAIFSRRVVGPADEDLLRGEDHLDGVAEALDVEAVVVVEELEQVDRRQVARRVVEVHVLASTGWSR